MKIRLPIAISAFVLLSYVLFLAWFGRGENGIAAPIDVNESGKQKANLIENYGTIPIHFESNQGQADKQVKFISRGGGYSLFLTPAEAVLGLQKPAAEGVPARADFLRIQLANTNPSAKIAGENLLEGKTNYIVGNDPGNWKTDIANFERVRYSNIYDGVDMVYYGAGKHLEYDFVVAPHSSPDQIKFAFNGLNSLAVADNGDLILKFGESELRQLKPVAYQEINGERKEIAANYQIQNNDVAFQLGEYDANLPLVIDPVLTYSTYLGGGADTFGTSIAVDSSGSAYVTGYTSALDFPTVNPFQTASNGLAAGFVTKLNPAGTAFVYSTYISGNSNTFPSSIKVDAAGSAYIGGWTLSSNFPTTAGAYRTTPPSGGGRPSFVTKLSPSGSSLIYSTYLGAVSDLTGLALDSAGNAYLTGYTQDAAYPTTPGAYKTTLGDGISQNAFVTKLNAAGSTLVYSTFVGAAVPFGTSVASDEANAIAVDSSGNAYITGLSFSNNYPTTSGAFQPFPAGRRDAFVTKLNANGSALVYSTYLGGGGQDVGRGIAVDSSGNAYVTGSFENDDFPFTSGGFLPSGGGGFFGLAFLTKVNPTGTALTYSTALGYRTTMAASGVAVGSDGSAYVIGSEGGGPGAYVVNGIQSASHSNDVWIAKMNPAGTGFTYSTPLGGNGISNQSAVGSAIALDPAGNAYFTGSTNAVDFPVTSGVVQATKSGGASSSAFVAKIGLQTSECPAIEISPQPPPVAVYNKLYNQQLNASGGVAPYTFSLAQNFGNNVLPVGLALAPNGTISGTPTNQNFGTYLVTVQAIDENGCIGVRTLKLDLVASPPRTSGIYLKVVSRPVIRIGNQYNAFIAYANRTASDLLNVPILIRVPDYVSLQPAFAGTALSFTQSGFNYVSTIIPRMRAADAGSDVQTLPIVIKVADPNRFNQRFSLEATILRDRRTAPVSNLTQTIQSSLSESIFISQLKSGNRPAEICKDDNIFNSDICDPQPLGSPVGPCYYSSEIVNPECQSYFPDDTEFCLLATDYTCDRIRAGNPQDPNDKTGSVGAGPEHFYTGDVVLPYSVTFENLASATLPAQDVVVTDQLDPNAFDLSTFSFNQIVFGDKQVSPQTGVNQFTTDVDLRPAKQAIVRVSGNFNSNSGLIMWQFHTLDPSTGQPPEDPNAGFLPPNITSPEGQGTLFYTVKAKAGLSTGTQIKNKARIVFDVNAPIDTPEWLNTIDNSKPVSSVTALPSSEPLSFTLNWSGTDVGSGISSYTIYISQDGGPYVPYLINTTKTSVTVQTTHANHTLRFYSIARDAAGNEEPAKTSAEATTTINLVSISGRVVSPTGLAIKGASVSITRPGGISQTVTTSSFGYFRFDNVQIGEQDVISVTAKRYRFTPRTLQVADELTNFDFIGF